MELVGVVAQTLWLRRNAVVHGKPNSSHNIVVSNAYNSLTVFKYANSQKFPRIVAEKRELCWKAPMDEFVSVNWDAIVDKTKKKMVISVINRDGKGEVLATLARPKNHI
jgi:hypothetical protein